MLVKTTKKELNNAHLQGKTILAFRATWCPPCQMMGPELEKLVATNPEINIYDLDVDSEVEFAREMQVSGIPSFFLYNDGKLLDYVTGYLPAMELAKKFNK
ncbi:thioredoxin family protein [Metamycoplasma buccale]|uniref:thioredoxin family protein n=1 Tax=Metamycoplasma buccale TaxID=55602 RepID=UPI00398F50A5